MAPARADARELMALLTRQRTGDSEVEQLGVADHGVQGRSQLVRHHRKELGLRLTRRLRFGARGPFPLELALTLDGSLPISNVAERYETRDRTVGATAPVGIHDPQFGGDCLPTS